MCQESNELPRQASHFSPSRELCESTAVWREAVLKIALRAKDLGEQGIYHCV